MSRITALIILLALALFLFGCSNSGGEVVAPSDTTGDPFLQVEPGIDGDGHFCWGVWQFVCNPDAGSVDIVKLRDADFHLNALKFLEPPPGLYLTLESAPQFSGKVMDVDIGLRHPFLGLVQFTGFDVCGILISHGSLSGFSDPHLILKGQGDTRLLNADGYTRWWNPSEFPYNEAQPIFGYKDGLMGKPDELMGYTATINGYKYFTDGLDAGGPAWNADLEGRGMFASGQKNIRHYKIALDNGLTFNYSVDANWKNCGLPPSQIDPPESFPADANRPEAWAVSITELDNSLYFEDSTGLAGGEISLELNVYDWFDADEHIVYGESLSGIPVTASSGVTGGGENYSIYQLDLPGESLTVNGEIDILITVESKTLDYGGLLPGQPVSTYFWCKAAVDDHGLQQTQGVFYVSGDKTTFEYGVLYANNEQWLKNMYRKATGECANKPIVKFYHGHGGFMMPCDQKDEIFGWIEGDGYIPIQSNEEPIDTTDCRHIHITMPGRFAPNFYSNAEIASLKQFILDGGILAVFAEVDYAHPDKTTYNHLIQSLGSGCAWAGDYTIEGSTFDTDKFDHAHTMFEGCDLIYWNLPAYLSTSKPTDNIIAWGLNGEAMFVESKVE